MSNERIQDIWASLNPLGKADQPCLYTWDKNRFRSVSFKDLNAQAHCAAGYLYANGLQPGQRVAFLTGQSLSAIVMDLAVQFLGGVGLHLPEDIAIGEMDRLVRENEVQFIFVGDHQNYLRLEQLQSTKGMVKGVFLETPDAEGLSAEKLVTFDIMVMRGKAVWREEVQELNARKAAVQPDDTYGLFAHNPAMRLQFAPVRFRRMLEHLHEAHTRLEKQSAPVFSTISPDRYLQHIHGSLAPLSYHRPLYLIETERLDTDLANDAHPGQLVALPAHLEDLYQRLPADFLKKPDGKMLEKAQELIDIREAAQQEGKKAPFMKNFRYKTHNQSLYKQVRKRLGGSLTSMISDHDEPQATTTRFFRECGLEVEGLALF